MNIIGKTSAIFLFACTAAACGRQDVSTAASQTPATAKSVAELAESGDSSQGHFSWTIKIMENGDAWYSEDTQVLLHFGRAVMQRIADQSKSFNGKLAFTNTTSVTSESAISAEHLVYKARNDAGELVVFATTDTSTLPGGSHKTITKMDEDRFGNEGDARTVAGILDSVNGLAN